MKHSSEPRMYDKNWIGTTLKCRFLLEATRGTVAKKSNSSKKHFFLRTATQNSVKTADRTSLT